MRTRSDTGESDGTTSPSADNFSDEPVDGKMNASRYCTSPHIVCIDLGESFAATMQSEEAFAVSLRLFYNSQAVINAHVQSIRSGYCHVADTGNVGWKNITFETDRRACQLCGGNAYPILFRQIAILNCRPNVRWFYNIIIARFLRPYGERVMFAWFTHRVLCSFA